MKETSAAWQPLMTTYQPIIPFTAPLREGKSEREKAEVGEKKMIKRFRSDGERARCRGGVREPDMVSKETGSREKRDGLKQMSCETG